LAASAAAALQFLSTFVSEPLISRITHRATDLSKFDSLVGNVDGLLRGLVLIWTLAAFGEEFVFRGYLLNRAADLGGRSSASWLVGLVGVSALFGLGHYYQGWTGAIDTTLTGLLLGGLYLATGRNLWAPILAHGISDTIALVLIFAGAVPGVGR
ncbi:MAG TPA: CPBP family intramembrane glutamic endopeptidase, partial [Planctomycetota bacterium]|nr:CPBP family intramembrane glutamic endopeptidase [Planctomycetota bacterium]